MNLSDLLKVFEGWGEWKKIRATPARIEELERRIATLEAGRAEPSSTCPNCEAGQLKKTGHPIARGKQNFQPMYCKDCGHREERVIR